jgi:hypothetical protein
LHVIFETWLPTLNPLTSGEPEPSVHVNEYFPLATLIFPSASAVTVKSPAIASAEFPELVLVEDEELDETDVLEELELEVVTDWPGVPGVPFVGSGSGSGWSRLIVSRTPSAQAILTVEPTK